MNHCYCKISNTYYTCCGCLLEIRLHIPFRNGFITLDSQIRDHPGQVLIRFICYSGNRLMEFDSTLFFMRYK